MNKYQYQYPVNVIQQGKVRSDRWAGGGGSGGDNDDEYDAR